MADGAALVATRNFRAQPRVTPERWQQVKSTLAGALEQDDTQARSAFLGTTCADDTDLRREVESLLDQPPDEFETIADTIGLANPEPLSPATTGRRIGPYELVRELGRGGMGTVWLARRADEHFEKQVAIKLLKRGTDTDEVLGRFRAERQILARLDHPNIARLLDAGTTDDHLPYFVMEYVEGRRLTDFVSEEKLSLGEQLRLFRKICGAVQFAHQNLVVHRDLKPANILVTSDGEPKLLDFGVAKLLAAGDDAWQITMAGRERFTPGYASPEQVRGEAITTVSDVYSLGALLYEMLTGLAPHRFPTSTPTALQIERVVCETEISRPSAVAHDPERRRQLRGDLDIILLRALAKSPERRYRGAGNFADDLRRYLENRPVQARPDTFGYRAGKFLRRNWQGALAAALVLLALLAGIIGTARQERIANRERARAERRFDQVRKIANSFMFQFHNLIAELPGSLAARQLVTQKAVDYLDSLAQEAGDDLALKSELAMAYNRIGNVTFDVNRAIATHEKAAALEEALVRAQPTNSSYRQQLSESYDHLSDVEKIAGHSARAIDYARKSLDLMRSIDGAESGVAEAQRGLAIALSDAGNLPEALANGRAALRFMERAAARHPNEKANQRDLGNVLLLVAGDESENGEHDLAFQHAEKALAIAQQTFAAEPASSRTRRELWSAHFHLGEILLAQGDVDAARPHLEQALQLMESLATADPNDTGHRRWLAVTNRSIGDLFATLAQPAEAIAHYRKANTISEQLLNEDPDRIEALRDLVRSYEALGLVFSKMDQPDSALQALRKAESLARQFATRDPDNQRIRSRLETIGHELEAVSH